MNKSIYEEVLEIIDRNIFELPLGYGVLYEIREKAEQALKQAQKQEKLLELYRELMTVKDMIIFFSYNRSYDDDTEEKERDLEKQIKELEKEIENERKN